MCAIVAGTSIKYRAKMESRMIVFVLAIQKYFGLLFPFVWQPKTFFGMPVPQFSLPFGTWHAAISFPEIV